MKRSIKHLPKRTQQELNVLIGLITQHVKGCEMIILYGSYARGEHVFWDERFDFGTHTVFQSDLDIMVVISKADIAVTERRLDNNVTSKYNRILKELRPTAADSNVVRYAPPEFIVEYLKTLNRELKNSQYFYTDIMKEGIVIYDTMEYKLAKPKKLSFEEIREIAVREYEAKFKFASDFLETGYFHLNKNKYVIGSFQLHQACERYYNAVALACNNYNYKTHELRKLLKRVNRYSPDLATVFPLNTDFEKRCYSLLCRAYIESRYNPDFVVNKEEFEYMLSRIEILKTITDRICNERIEFYDSLIIDED